MRVFPLGAVKSPSFPSIQLGETISFCRFKVAGFPIRIHNSAWYIPLTAFIPMTKTPKIALNFFLTGLSFFISLTAPASAALLNFQVNFLDENSNLVGNGQFSYDDESSTCLELSPAGVCEPNDPLFGLLDAMIVTNLLTDVSATVGGKTWGLGGTSWWSDDDSGQLASSLLSLRGNFSLRENNLFFQDILETPLTTTGSLNLSITQSSDSQGEGNWQLSFFDPNNPNGINSDSGTWQARQLLPEPPSSSEKVPEPSTLIASLISIGLASYSQRKVIIGPIRKIQPKIRRWSRT